MWLQLLAQASSVPIDPVEAAKVFGVALPMIATMGEWLRRTLKERDRLMTENAELREKRLEDLREVLPLAQTMVAVAERMERRLG